MTNANRFTTSIKLTDDDFKAIKAAAINSQYGSFREYSESILNSFISQNLNREEVILLKPTKSAGYRSIAVSKDLGDTLKLFAARVDASVNGIIHTAFKNSINQHSIC